MSKNVFDDIAALVTKYGELHEKHESDGDLAAAGAYRVAALDLCNLIISKGNR